MHKESVPTFKTNRLLLQEITSFDLEHIYSGLSHPSVIKYYGVSYDSLEATKEQLIWFEDEQQAWWTIRCIDDHTFYGAGGLNAICHKTHTAEIGLWLLPKFWGNGIMKEALPVICDYGLNTLKLKRIEGFVETHNINCKKAMAKLDFEHERTIDNFEMKNGVSISVDVYAKTI